MTRKSLGRFRLCPGEGYELVQQRTKRPKYSNRTRVISFSGGSCCHRQLLQGFPVFPVVSGSDATRHVRGILPAHIRT
jgi:hypothetical protein